MYNNILHVLSLFLSQQITVNKCTLLDGTNSVLYTYSTTIQFLITKPKTGYRYENQF